MGAFGIEIGSERVCIYGPDTAKREALDTLVDAVSQSENITDKEALRQAVHDREAIMSTGIGTGIAVPHVRLDSIRAATIAVGISRSGIDFDTLDDQPVHIVVLFAMPAGSQKEYLGLLAQTITSLKATGYKEKLLACSTPEDVASLINGSET